MISLVIIGSIIAQDDFFEPGHTIGGYGELHWNQVMDNDNNKTKNTLDFHRFIIFFGYNYSEKWSFKSELEIEHNMIDGSGDYDGEVELEQAYVNYHSGNWGFKAGVILTSVGYINEIHEPPTFLSVERPDYAKYVIPTTWFGNGFGFYGNVFGVDWKVNIMEDLKASGIGDGIRDARGKGYKTTAYDWTKNIRFDYNEIPSINIGGSMTMNNAPSTFNDDGTVNESIGVSLMEFHGSYNANNLTATMEYGNISYTDNAAADGTSGYYLDVGYDISEMISCEGKLIPWIRYGNVQKDVDDSSSHYDVMKFGLSYFPIDQIAFKIDYGTNTYENDDDNKTLINIGVGYMF
ncbi:MAG: hypothetical protein VX820_02310 [Candidatus Neomarinimicrobiota bacterium]|nr:hypothetical protein [Candidatus Neomarinimicrobiota bacterium]|tara:strand:+ start:803 stop:1849 length:1047 start_codon:yes stop_codon:yes gene_type:complete